MAPMEGVVDAVTRQLYSRIGGFDRFVTEFIRVTDKIIPDHVFYKYAPELKAGGRTLEGSPVYVQLLGGQADVIAQNASRAVALGAPGIDLNFGCPAPTVNRHDGGATLLKNPERVYQVVSAVRKAVPASVPVTAKVRLGFDHKDFCNEIAQAADSAGAAQLTVHARTRNEGYKPPAHWHYIAHMKAAVKNTQVVANGDIWCVDDYWACRKISNCEHVALGRGAIARPDLAKQIRLSIKPFAVQLQSDTHLACDTSRETHFAWQDVYKYWLPQFINDSEVYRDSGYAVARTKQWLRQLSRTYPEAQIAFDKIKLLKHTREIYETINAN